MNMKIKILALVLLATGMKSIAQIGLNPQIGLSYHYMYTQANLADTGSVGSNQIWDFNYLNPDPSGLLTFNYRMPTQFELAYEPNIDFVADVLDGDPTFYRQNADSIYAIGFIDMTNETYTPYSNLNTVFLKPSTANDQWSFDTFKFQITEQGDQYDVHASHKWKITGTGTLINDFGTYTNVIKVSRYIHYVFSYAGIEIMEVDFIEIAFFDENFSRPIFVINHDDFSGFSNSYTYFDASADVEKLQKNQYAYPVPAKDLLSIDPIVDSYILTGLNGKEILKGTENKLDVSALPRGLYILRMKINGELQTQRISLD